MKKRLTTHTSTFHLHPPAHLPCLKDFPPPSRLFLSFLSTRSHSPAQKQWGQSPLSEVATATSVAPERGAPRGPSPSAMAPATGLRCHQCLSWTVRAPGSSERRTRQPFSPGSEMASWHRASESSPSCRVTWVAKQHMASSCWAACAWCGAVPRTRWAWRRCEGPCS